MAVNSVQESLSSLPDEPNPRNYFHMIDQEAKTNACCNVQWAGKQIFMLVQMFVVELLLCSEDGLRSDLRASN